MSRCVYCSDRIRRDERGQWFDHSAAITRFLCLFSPSGRHKAYSPTEEATHVSDGDNSGPRWKRYLLVPLFIAAWLLHGLSEWCYDSASWLYKKCGSSIFEASITWEE